ncbi:branched-chain amino acid ABC transporter permease [Lachnospiraceae bacterium oral taxon 500]|nr:branched-chain amino acid ABC transporter permease [Lachnospiraceae bacterium oral taxon 500]
MNLVISAIAQGFLWSIVSLGLFISFRILNVADMTTEGSYPLGAAVCVILIYNGFNPVLAMAAAVIAGMLAGAITGFFITVCRIPSLLAGILAMTGLLSINLRIMQRANLSLLNQDTIFDWINRLPISKYAGMIAIGLLAVIILILFIRWFFLTEIGQALIATGDNPKMAASMGISTERMTVLGLVLANGMIALAGAILAQNNGYADVNSGQGVIVIGLVAIIIGEVIFSRATFFQRLGYTVLGAVIYRLLLLLVLKLDFISANDFKLLSAALIAGLLALPKIKAALGAKSKLLG